MLDFSLYHIYVSLFPPDETTQPLIKSFTSFRNGSQLGNLSVVGLGFFCISGAFVEVERLLGLGGFTETVRGPTVLLSSLNYLIFGGWS